MISQRLAALALFVAVPFTLPAQDTGHSYTRMIVGGGFPPAGARVSVLVGFEFAAKSPGVTFRLAAEAYGATASGESGSTVAPSYFHSFSVYGLQLLGERTFRRGHRIEPYALGGVGLYHRNGHASSVTTIPADGPGFPTYSYGAPQPYRSTTPTFIWGGGLNVRVGGMRLFGELKPGIVGMGSGTLRWPPHSPLVFGIRF